MTGELPNDGEVRMLQRAELYAWLAAALYLPEQDVIADGFLESGAALSQALFPGEQVSLTDLLDSCALDQPADDRLLELRREYARLFIGPPQALVRPYESCYFGDARLMTERTIAVGRFYEACGFTVDSSEDPEPPDHIAVELTFLSLVPELIPAVAEDISERSRIEQTFLDMHLGQWAARFAESVRENTAHPFYLAAADLLHVLVRRFCGDGIA